ncbi:hypothetical protein [Acanthopleuribacter pedis]|uniref:Uncharacterized protein n=1 Tax=Acanthopleuribacter pedis TaxID=442870 RepID=A0A8J7QKG0_9BACT|nr:hypothetical protein [Acanthopleuribacter pedis]MBO1319853.1 hypothetical protein [Acanthopleuribacter pedis]
MANDRVVLDETSLLDGEARLQTAPLAAFLEVLESIFAHSKSRLLYSSAVFSMLTRDGVPLLQLLYPSRNQSSAERDTLRRFQILLSKGHSFENEREVLSIKDTLVESHGLTYAFQENAAARYKIAAQLMARFEPGRLPAEDDDETGHLWLMNAHPDYLAFMRELAVRESPTPEAFWQACPILFPNLIIHERATKQTKTLSQSFENSLPDLVEHLAAINDHFATCHRESKGDRETIIDAFFLRSKVTISPESPNTHKNKKAMAARLVTLDHQPDKEIECEWHSKIKPHTDRIYFSIPQAETGKIVIGIICDHLPT